MNFHLKQILNATFLLVFLGLLSGCQSNNVRHGGAGNQSKELRDWVVNDLSPYLATQFSQGPKYNGESFAIVNIRGDDVQSGIDPLTRQVRAWMRDELLNTAGVMFPWMPSQRLPEHHRNPNNAFCGRRDQVHYLIGVDVSLTDEGKGRVEVGVLDAQEKKWERGLAKTWIGAFSDKQRSALSKVEPDESLRGLRVLPFTDLEPDLIADYLANNLSCLVRFSEYDNPIMHIERARGDSRELQSVVDLLGFYLSRLNEVRITDDPKHASILLSVKHYLIARDVYQIWIALSPKGEGGRLSGMDTSAYFRMTKVFKPKEPVVSNAEAMYDGEASHFIHEENLGTYTPEIAHFRIMGVHSLYCDSKDSEQLNSYPIRAPYEISSNRCFMLDYQVNAAVDVFLLSFNNKGEHGRLSHVGSAGEVDPRGARQQRIWRRTSDLIRARHLSGVETYYLIAVSDIDLSSRINSLLAQLPMYSDWASGKQWSTDKNNRWLQRLDRLIGDNEQHIAWTALRVRIGD